MATRKSYLPELRGMLCPVMIDHISDITGEIPNFTRTTSLNPNTFRLETDKVIRSLNKKLRDDIYDVFISDQFLRKFPKMKLVKNLKVTSLQKCIIMMSGIDIEIDDICDFLRASKESVRSQRSKMSKDIERIFGRKPWMKK